MARAQWSHRCGTVGAVVECIASLLSLPCCRARHIDVDLVASSAVVGDRYGGAIDMTSLSSSCHCACCVEWWEGVQWWHGHGGTAASSLALHSQRSREWDKDVPAGAGCGLPCSRFMGGLHMSDDAEERAGAEGDGPPCVNYFVSATTLQVQVSPRPTNNFRSDFKASSSNLSQLPACLGGTFSAIRHPIFSNCEAAT